MIGLTGRKTFERSNGCFELSACDLQFGFSSVLLRRYVSHFRREWSTDAEILFTYHCIAGADEGSFGALNAFIA